MKYRLCVPLLLVPSLAFADNPSGLLYFFSFQFLVLFWPLLLPLFFLKAQTRKISAYFVLVFLAFGAKAMVSFPLDILTATLSVWDKDSMNLMFAARIAIAIFVPAIVLWFYGTKTVSRLVGEVTPLHD